jgi:hypothetical protein
MEYLDSVMDELKARVPARNSGARLSRDPDYTSFRYFGALDARCYYSIGLTNRFASEEMPTPVWLRFHKDTKDFKRVRQRLLHSEFSQQMREARGHIWLPLTVDTDLDGSRLVDDLAAQVGTILSAAAPPATADPEPIE